MCDPFTLWCKRTATILSSTSKYRALIFLNRYIASMIAQLLTAMTTWKVEPLHQMTYGNFNSLICNTIARLNWRIIIFKVFSIRGNRCSIFFCHQTRNCNPLIPEASESYPLSIHGPS